MFNQQGKRQEKNLSQDLLERKVCKENIQIKCEIWDQFSKIKLQSTLRDEKCILGQNSLHGIALSQSTHKIMRIMSLYQVGLIEYSTIFTKNKTRNVIYFAGQGSLFD